MSDAILTVGQLTRSVKTLLEGNFPFVWVRGQVSNCARPSSGHLYFSLKDEEAVLNAVWFKTQQKDAEAFDPMTGEVFEDGPRPSLAATLENGREIICAGRLTVYPPRGAYQMVVELAQDAGKGRLHLEFERIKAALAARGYFSLERKRSLPANPVRVSVITAPAGAAVRDFLRMAEDRGIGCEIRIRPALVQGDAAPAQIAAALDAVNAEGWAQVAVLLRGGGSLEDLWAFNAEEVADAVFRSAVPVLTGIGHEVDVSIADLVADMRAATPTHAAQLLWTEKRELAQRLDELDLNLGRAWQRDENRRAERFAALTARLALLSPARTLARWEERLEHAATRLRTAMSYGLERREALARTLGERLPVAADRALVRSERAFERLVLCLGGLDPLLPLERGYALARDGKGRFIRSVRDVAPGDPLDLMLRDGTVPVRVERDNENGALPSQRPCSRAPQGG